MEENIDIKVFKKACVLTFEFDKGNNLYGFLIGKTSKEMSNIEQFKDGYAAFEVENDDIFYFILIKSDNLTICDVTYTENGKEYTEPGFKIGNFE